MGTKVTRRRHTGSEIATKLATADGMAARGVLHRDIARSLGISVMTYHRWRKARDEAACVSVLEKHIDRRLDRITSAIKEGYAQIYMPAAARSAAN